MTAEHENKHRLFWAKDPVWQQKCHTCGAGPYWTCKDTPTTCLSSHLVHYGNLLIGSLIFLLPLQTICGTAARVSQMMSLLCLKPFPGISPRVEAKVLSTADKPVHNSQDSVPCSLNFKHTAFLRVLKSARHVPSSWHVPLLFTLLCQRWHSACPPSQLLSLTHWQIFTEHRLRARHYSRHRWLHPASLQSLPRWSIVS